MPLITIQISDEQAKAVEHLVATGKYADGNDVLSAALDELDLRYRLDHADPAAIQLLGELIEEGIASGPAEPLDVEAFLLELKAKAETHLKSA